MSSKEDLEDRLKLLGLAVAEIQQRLGSANPAGHGLDGFLGAFNDEPAFDQVVALGREFGRQDYPGDGEPAHRTDQ